MIDPIDYNRPLPPEVLADAMHDTVHCGPTPFPPACEECGHIRYETDLHSGHCPVCELWAENEIRALRAEVERLKVAEGEAMLVVESQDASIAALKADLEKCRKAYGKLFNENAALQGEIDALKAMYAEPLTDAQVQAVWNNMAEDGDYDYVPDWDAAIRAAREGEQ